MRMQDIKVGETYAAGRRVSGQLRATDKVVVLETGISRPMGRRGRGMSRAEWVKVEQVGYLRNLQGVLDVRDVHPSIQYFRSADFAMEWDAWMEQTRRRVEAAQERAAMKEIEYDRLTNLADQANVAIGGTHFEVQFNRWSSPVLVVSNSTLLAEKLIEMTKENA